MTFFFDLGPHVKAEHLVHVVAGQRAALTDHFGAADALFCGLEDHQHIELFVFAVVFVQIVAQGQHHGHVGVVAAGVHAAVGGGKGQPCLLLDGQGVHISPESEGVAGAIVKKGGVAGAAHLFHGAIQAFQVLANVFAGLEFLAGSLRHLVQVSAVLDVIFHGV